MSQQLLFSAHRNRVLSRTAKSRAPGRRQWVAAAAALLAGAAGLVVGGPAVPAISAEPGIAPVGTFTPTVLPPGFSDSRAYGQIVTLFTAPRQRVLYTIDSQFVAAYNLDTLQPLSAQGVVLDGVASVALVDPDTGDLLVANGRDPSGATGIPVGTTGVQQIHAQSGSVRSIGTMTVGATDLGGPGQTVAAMARQPGTPYLYLLSTDVGNGPGNVHVSIATTGEGPHVVQSQGLPGCQTLGSTAASLGLAVQRALGLNEARRALYFACGSQGTGGVYKPPAIPNGVGSVVLSGSNPPSIDHFESFPRAGDLTAGGGSVYDPGTHRLVFTSYTSGTGATGYVFDTAAQAFVGGLGLGGNAVGRLGLDAAHGRLYVPTGEQALGLVASDLGATPADQGRSYPQYSESPQGRREPGSPNSPAGTAPAVDDVTGRLFLLYGGDRSFSIVRDTVPYFQAPAPPDPDLGTLNHVEQPGVTAASVAASAQGYGAVYRQVGGLHNLAFNTVPLDARSGGGTRELDSAYLTKLKLGTSEVSASAISSAPDQSTTAGDLQQTGQGWPIAPAACSDFGGKPKQTASQGATAACDASKPIVAAGADSGQTSVTAGSDGFGASSASVTAKAYVDPKLGTVTTVTSTAKGVSALGGLLRVGEVSVTATATAHGRPGTGKTTFDRTVQNVVLAGTTLCTSPCNTDLVAAQVNAQLPGRLRVDFPDPEPVAARGSPGGFQALIQRAPAEQVQAVQVEDQAQDRQEVPGMVVTQYGDNTTPSQTIAYLAGTEVEARYGIYLLSRVGSGTAAGGKGGAVAGAGTGGGRAGSAAGDGGAAGRAGGGRRSGTPSAAPTGLRPGTPGTPGIPGTAPIPATAGDASAGSPVATDGPTGSLPGSPPGAEPVVPTAVASGDALPVAGPLSLLHHGWQFALAGLGHALQLVPLWLLLLAPVYLSARRRLLQSRATLALGGTA